MTSAERRTLAALTVVLLSACGTPRPRVEPPAAPASPPAAAPAEAPKAAAKKPVLKYGGGFYKDDGPAAETPENLDAIADAEPKWEPLHKGALKPYVVFGRDYVPNTAVKPYKARGRASWYGKKFHGQKTSIGEPYDMFAMTAAHTTLALPSYARVSNPENGRTVVVRIIDRGPFHPDRIIDLSYTAAYKLGIVGNGSGLVEVEAIVPGEPTGTTYAQVTPPRPEPRRETGPVLALAEISGDDDIGAFISRLDQGETPPPAGTGRGTWLQLGAFGNPDNADSLRSHLAREIDWLAEAIQIDAGGGIHRVQVGPYRTRAEAEKVAERMRKEFGTKPTFVVR